MRDKIISNDYVGFTFNGIHSSQLGIVRTSDGSRFNENLLPTIQDKTVQIPGGDGTYYFGSYYTQKPINISFAFDDLTEQEFAELKSWLGDKKIHPLIFDESPYKAYQAKVTGSATIKHIPFGEVGERVYKGEGSIQFTAYQPFARSVFKFLNESNFENEEEWATASRMRNNPHNGTRYDEIIYQSGSTISSGRINLYNAGDKETDFLFTLEFIGDGSRQYIPATKISILNDPYRQLRLKEIIRISASDYCVKINSKLNIIEGYDSNGKKTGNVYNSVISEGSFFKIPMGESTLIIDEREARGIPTKPIDYDYYYL